MDRRYFAQYDKMLTDDEARDLLYQQQVREQMRLASGCTCRGLLVKCHICADRLFLKSLGIAPMEE